MPLPFYTTKIKASKTASEIQELLSKAGAIRVVPVYEHGKLVSMSFTIETPYGVLPYSLPINIAAVQKTLIKQAANRDAPISTTTPERAEMVAWRIMKSWVITQLALVETQMVSVDEIFLPYLRINSGETLYQRMIEGGYRLALPDGGVDAISN